MSNASSSSFGAAASAAPDRADVRPAQTISNVLRWWRAPFWLFALLTGAKSFVDNPILGSRRLNRAGLHLWRLRLAHAMAWSRRARLTAQIPCHLREKFDRNGFVVIPNALPTEDFRKMQSELLSAELDCREHVQGDAITRRVPVNAKLLRRFGSLSTLIDGRSWKGLMAYAASTRAEPLLYLQTIVGGVGAGPADPQEQLHADTFHPSLKAWLFLTDVEDCGRPLTYVAGSHRLTPARAEWEYRKSLQVLDHGDRLSQRGSFRISPGELEGLGLPPPTRFDVPANTLVVVDTCGFHARASSDRPSVRVEVWAYCRRSPFLPWVGGLFSWRPILLGRAEWLGMAVDWLDRRGWMKQHWRPAGKRRVADP